MRAVIQRVAEAAVAVAGEEVGAIGPGLVVLVGVAAGDSADDARALASKVANLRVFPDDSGRMNRSLLDQGGAALVISQFTLLADVHRGRRPSFVAAAAPDDAEPIVAEVVGTMRRLGIEVATGSFGARMSVRLVNEGPVTIVVDAHGGRIA